MISNRQRVLYDKKDIKMDCKFCVKGVHGSYGYECKIKLRKRKMKRCCWCLFGHINFGH